MGPRQVQDVPVVPAEHVDEPPLLRGKRPASERRRRRRRFRGPLVAYLPYHDEGVVPAAGEPLAVVAGPAYAVDAGEVVGELAEDLGDVRIRLVLGEPDGAHAPNHDPPRVVALAPRGEPRAVRVYIHGEYRFAFVSHPFRLQ